MSWRPRRGMPPSPNELKVLRCVESYIARTVRAPRLEEVWQEAAHAGFDRSAATIRNHLQRLQIKGHVEAVPTTRRTVFKLTPSGVDQL